MSLPYHKPPPSERPNWERMNEGQRRYAMEQYNLALVRRGAKFTPPKDDSDEEDFDIDNFVNERYNHDLGAGNQGASQGSQATNPSPPNSQENQAADNFLNQLEDRLPNRSPLPELLSPMDTLSQDYSQVSSSSTGSKRGGEDSGGIPPKKAKATTSGSQLPGTSGNTDGMIGGSGVNGAAESAPIQSISRGITSHKQTFTFTKRWKFLTFGIADQILNDTTSGAGRLALTTSLAAIPWEYAFFYMSPAEWNRLQDYRGVFAKHCNISISQFNPRVAFQTADTTSTTATLNQNKFTRWALGIRSNGGLYCSDRDYVYDSSEPMKPTGFDSATPVQNRLNLIRAMYGVQNTATIAQHNAAIPAYATGQELELQQYLTIYAPKIGDSGFPPYDQYCHEGNSMDFLGQEILKQSYTFEYAPLQRKHPMVFETALQETSTTRVDVMAGTKFEGSWVKELPTSKEGIPTMVNEPDLRYTLESTTTTNTDNTNFESDRPYYKFPMEQNGTYMELSRKMMDYGNQPSVHVGVRAVPKLSTDANLIQTDSWLDTQIYWIVQASLTVEASDSYFYIRGGPTIMPSQVPLVNCFKTTTEPPVFTPLLQTNDRTYIAGRRSAVINTTNG